MNPDIENFINSYVNMINTYASKVDPGNEKLLKAREYLEKMKQTSSASPDMPDFMGRVAEDDMMNKMSRYITELAEAGLAQDRASGKMKIPTAEEYGAAYHEAYKAIEDKEGQPETCKIYRRIFQLEEESEFAPEFMRKLAEERLLLKMSSVQLFEQFNQIIKEAEKLSQPVMAFHNEQMALMAQRATSPNEIELESQRLVELNRIELMCDEMLTHDLYYRLGVAISSYLLSGSDDDLKRVEKNYRFVADFFGVDMDELYRIPRVYDLIDRLIVPAINQKEKIYTTESFIEEHKSVIKKSLGGGDVRLGPESRKSAVLWGKTIALNDMLKAFRNPQRPDELVK